MLNARYICIAYSGKGIYRNNTGSTSHTIPDLYNLILPGYSNTLWTTSDYVPDAVVINIGTNDFAPEGNPNPKTTDSSQFVNAYINFLTMLRSSYPTAHIFCVVPNSITDANVACKLCYTRIKRYHNAIVNHFTTLSDNQIYYFELTPQSSPYGEDWHPTNATQLAMANQIVPFIQSKTGW